MRSILFLITLLASCQFNKSKEEKTEGFSEKAINQSHNIKDSQWIVAYRTLREDIYQKRPEKFIEFPFINESIWYLIESTGKENKYNKSSISIQEFNKHYGEIFDKEFISLLLKVKSNDLYKSTEFTTFKHCGDTISYSLNASYDVNEKKISISMHYMQKFPLKDGEFEGGESTEGFVFYLVGDRFYLKEIVLAG